MNKKYDYEWITEDLNNSIILRVVNEEKKCVKSYQAVDVINCIGDDVVIGQANIYDISNLLTIGTIRFTSFDNNEILDIPFRNIYKLFENSNVITLDINKLEINNNEISFDELDAFAVINGNFKSNNYKIISTKIGKESEALNKFINIAKQFGKMSMDEKIKAIASIDELNYKREKELKM